jgi:putative hydrolase of the HAD superfamily
MGRCLVLDFDGTVLDTEAPLYLSYAELWEAHGHELARVDWQAIIGTHAGFDPVAELERRLGRALAAEVHERQRARREELQAAEALRPGIARWLVEASEAGVPVAIASSSSIEWVEAHLAAHDLRHHFEVVVCRDDVVPPKPDPTSYRLACERLGADPRASVAVEDSPHGVAAAVGAGLFTLAVPHGLTHDLDFSAADLVVGSLEELTLVDALGRAAGR